MKAWTKFFTLSLPEQYVLLEAVLAVLAAELALRLFSLQTFLDFLQQNTSRLPGTHESDMERLARFVDIADRNTPGNSSCLRRAVALAYCFRWHGIRADLCIGAYRDHDMLHAHAWIQTDNGRVFGKSDEIPYTPLSKPFSFNQSMRREKSTS